MIRLALLFPALCFVLLGAHLMFHGYALGVSLLVLIPAVLLFVRHRWCALFCAIVLIASGIEWAYTAFDLAVTRFAYGQPWMRATAIISSCAAITWLAAAMLFWSKFDAYYKRGQN